MFGQDPRRPGLAILRDQKAFGFVIRSPLIECIPARFSSDPFGPWPPSALMGPHTIQIEASAEPGSMGTLKGDRPPSER